MGQETNGRPDPTPTADAAVPYAAWTVADVRRARAATPEWDVCFVALVRAVLAHAAPDDDWPGDSLALYVADDLAGRDPAARFPALHDHLAACPECRAVVSDLRQMLHPDPLAPTAPPAVAPPALSFLQPSPPTAAWVAHLASRLTGAPFRLDVRLSPDYLRARLSPSASLATRADEALIPGPVVLVSHIVTAGPQLLAVEVTATPTAAHTVHVRATLAASDHIPTGLRALLSWAGADYIAPVDHTGHADFGPLSLSDLEASLAHGHTVCLAFEDIYGGRAAE